MLIDSYYCRGRQYFGAYRHWCVSTHDGTAVVPKVQQVRELKLQTHDMPCFGVGGNPVPTLGCSEVEVEIAAGVYKAPVVVSARKERPNFIIGADFLSTHDCDLSTRQKLFTVRRDSVRCLPERVRASHARLKLARRVELPPHSEVLVSCKASQSIKHFGTSCAVAQPANNSWRYAEDGLVIGSSFVSPDKATHHIPVMNLSAATRSLHEGTGWEISIQSSHSSMSNKCSGWTQTCLIGNQMMMS